MRKVLSDDEEVISLERGRLLMPERGALPLLSFLDQAFSRVNAIEIEITIGEKEITRIRKADKALERRLGSILRPYVLESTVGKVYRARLKLVVLIG